MRSLLAVVAYWLACLGPLAFLVMGIDWPPVEPFAQPISSRQLLWWLCCLCSPAGMVLGMIAHVRIRRSSYLLTGSNYALAGIIVGGIASIALALGTPDLLAMRPSYSSSCISNIKQLNLGMLMYALDYDEHLPVPDTWNEELTPYVKYEQVYRCPAEPVKVVPSYGMNRLLGGLNPDNLVSPDKTVLLFDSLPGKDRFGGRGLLPDPPRHDNYQIIGFVDGHAKAIEESRIGTLCWKPVLKKK